MEALNVERRLAAIMATDVVGYSRLMEVDEAGTLARLRAHRLELVEPAIAKAHGRVIKTSGDGMLVEFPSVTGAISCAAEVQHRMARRNQDVPPARRIEFRIGINVGDVIVEDGDIFGDGVNVAARLESLAEPGAIYVSAAVRDQVGDRLDIDFQDLGEQHLKNLTRPVRVFRIVLDKEVEAATDAASSAGRTGSS
jgi:adenylate cyclase